MVETKNSRRNLTVSALQRCLSVIQTVLVLYGFSVDGYRIGNTLRHWRNMCEAVGGEDSWIKVAKYKLAAFYAAHTDNPLPKVPWGADAPESVLTDNPAILLGGRAYRFLQYYLRANPLDGDDEQREKRFSLLQSLKQAKKGMPRAGRAQLKKAEADMIKDLTTARPTAPYVALRDWADADELNAHQDLYFTKAKAQSELLRTVRELFEDQEYSIEDRIVPFLPSTSANYINSRSGLGAVGSILTTHRELLNGLRHPNTGVDFRRSEARDEGEEEMKEEKPGYDVDVSRIENRFSTFYSRLLDAATREEPLVSPVALPEALKIRTISKGPPLTYTALKPLQRFMWRVLKSHPSFKLIGTPVTARLVQNQLGQRLRDDEVYLSGDYKSATDRLHSWVSETIAMGISECVGLSGDEEELLLKSLTGHVFVNAEGDFVDQRTGQLMGSVTSFPILCIANAAMTRYALEQACGRRMLLRNLPALFNGDDIVARTTRLGCELWRKVTAFIGLEESVGKTYYSRIFFEINSTCFLRLQQPEEVSESIEQKIERLRKRLHGVSAPPPQPPLFLRQVPYVNMGLMLGMKRSGTKVDKSSVVSGSDAERDGTIGARARELYSSCPPSLRGKVMDRFILQHKKLLSEVHVPWFIPEAYGGVGLPSYVSPIGLFRAPSMFDMRCAMTIKVNGLPVNRGTKSAWQLHRLALQRLPGKLVALESEEQQRKFDLVYGRLVASLLFDSRVDLEDLYTPVSDTKGLRANERLWSRVKPISQRYLSRPASFVHFSYDSIGEFLRINEKLVLTQVVTHGLGSLFASDKIVDGLLINDLTSSL